MKQVLIYDINTIPEIRTDIGESFELVMKLYKEENIVLWDSSKSTQGVNCKPSIINTFPGTDLKIIDYSTAEGKEELKRLTK